MRQPSRVHDGRIDPDADRGIGEGDRRNLFRHQTCAADQVEGPVAPNDQEVAGMHEERFGGRGVPCPGLSLSAVNDAVLDRRQAQDGEAALLGSHGAPVDQGLAQKVVESGPGPACRKHVEGRHATSTWLSSLSSGSSWPWNTL